MDGATDVYRVDVYLRVRRALRVDWVRVISGGLLEDLACTGTRCDKILAKFVAYRRQINRPAAPRSG